MVGFMGIAVCASNRERAPLLRFVETFYAMTSALEVLATKMNQWRGTEGRNRF